MYGAIYKCKMCGKELPYIAPDAKEAMKEFYPEEELIYTPYGAPFPEERISGNKTDPPRYIPHYCNGDKDTVGMAELVGFKEMADQLPCKNWKLMTTRDKTEYLYDEFECHGIEEYAYQPIVEFILRDGFDMTGWRLYDAPALGRYCFYKEDTNQCFDIYIKEDIIKAQYMDSKVEEYCNSMFDAETIEDAVNRYSWPELGILPKKLKKEE